MSTDRTKKSDFPCPLCGGNNTAEIILSNKEIKALKDKEWPVIYGTDTMPHYLRSRTCEDCKGVWKTCESIVIHSVLSKNGDIVL